LKNYGKLLREDTAELAGQGTGSPETTSSIEEGGDLSGSSTVSGGETEDETVAEHRESACRSNLRRYQKSYSSFKSLGLTMGYFGFKEDPAYILPRISSERVSWLNEEIVNVCRDLVEKLITHIW
jgi:hypothetical protein